MQHVNKCIECGMTLVNGFDGFAGCSMRLQLFSVEASSQFVATHMFVTL